MFLAGAGFTLLELATAPALGPHTVVKAFGLTTIAVALVTLRSKWAEENIRPFSVAIISVGYVGTALSGILSPSGEYATSAIVFISASLVSATILPWGPWAQSVTVLIAAASLAANVWFADGSLAIMLTDPGAAVCLALASSVAIAHEVRHARQESARQYEMRCHAEETVRALNADLERRVLTRTAELALVNQRLQDESEQRRQTEERLRRRQDELAHVQRLYLVNEMAAAVAHEIHQPLGAIANYAQAGAHRLRRGEVDPPELLRICDRIAAESLRAGGILRGLRRLASQGGTSMEIVDLNGVIAEAAAMLELQARRHHVEVEINPSTGDAPVVGDRTQLEQAVVNLLLNAIDAASESPDDRRRVALSAQVDGEQVQVSVRDTGPGIPADAVAKLFTPFFTTKPNGLGMGLAISRTIAEAHGGSLASARPSRGAEFRIVLPLVHAQESRAAHAPAHSAVTRFAGAEIPGAVDKP